MRKFIPPPSSSTSTGLHKWTDDEIVFLRTHLFSMSERQLSRELSRRWEHIRFKIQELDITGCDSCAERWMAQCMDCGCRARGTYPITSSPVCHACHRSISPHSIYRRPLWKIGPTRFCDSHFNAFLEHDHDVDFELVERLSDDEEDFNIDNRGEQSQLQVMTYTKTSLAIHTSCMKMTG